MNFAVKLQRMHICPRRATITLAALSALAIGGAVIADLNTYMSAPGTTGVVPSVWPAKAGTGFPEVPRDDGGWTFVLTAHPACPCTRATTDQLLRALGNAGSEDRLVVLVRSASTRDLGVLEPLRRLEGVTFIADPDSALSNAFGGLTSGYLIAFDPEGRTAFAGGLTPRRGIVGPSTGFEAVRALTEDKQPAADRAEVFGCPLCGTDESWPSSGTSLGSSE